MMRAALFALALVAAAPILGCEHAPALNDNAELAEMFAADQAARQAPITNWESVSKADAARRKRTRALLDAGELNTAGDFYAAAFIFQHGEKPEDYLLAHGLAMRSLGLGDENAEWIAAATLDRYLISIGRPQIYGTQFRSEGEEGMTQEPFDRDLVADQLRLGAKVPTLEQQESQRLRLGGKQKISE